MADKIKTGLDGKRYIVFADEYEADEWEWLYCDTLQCCRACFNGYMNAFCLS